MVQGVWVINSSSGLCDCLELGARLVFFWSKNSLPFKTLLLLDQLPSYPTFSLCACLSFFPALPACLLVVIGVLFCELRQNCFPERS